MEKPRQSYFAPARAIYKPSLREPFYVIAALWTKRGVLKENLGFLFILCPYSPQCIFRGYFFQLCLQKSFTFVTVSRQELSLEPFCSSSFPFWRVKGSESRTWCVTWASLPLAPPDQCICFIEGGMTRSWTKRPWRKEVKIQATVSLSFLMQKERSALEVCPLLPSSPYGKILCWPGWQTVIYYCKYLLNWQVQKRGVVECLFWG